MRGKLKERFAEHHRPNTEDMGRLESDMKKIRWHSKEEEEVLRELDANRTTGLNSDEVGRRLETYG